MENTKAQSTISEASRNQEVIIIEAEDKEGLWSLVHEVVLIPLRIATKLRMTKSESILEN